MALTPAAEDALRAARDARGEIVEQLREELGAGRVDAATELLHDVLRARGSMPLTRNGRAAAR